VASKKHDGEGDDGGREVPVAQAATIAAMLRGLQEQQAQISRAIATIYMEGPVAKTLTVALAYQSPAISAIIRLTEMSLAQAGQRIAEYNKMMQLAATVIKAQDEAFAGVRARLESIHFSTAALAQFRSPVIALAANAEVITRAFEGVRNAGALMALALRPTWELQRLTGILAGPATQFGSPETIVAERTIEAATLQTTQASETVSEILPGQARWLVNQPQPATLPTFNLFKVQQEEIRRLSASRGTPPNIEALPSVAPATLARYVCHLVTEVNNHAIGSRKDPVFRPTNRLVEGAAGLPFIIATSLVEFRDFINLLFQMLYEGAGAVARFQGDLTDDELAPIWQLKHLRLWAFHDIEHGDARDIAEKQHKITQTFYHLIGKPAPAGEDDYRIAQVRLLESLARMLDLLRDKLSRH
jgi:hypothetical protein